MGARVIYYALMNLYEKVGLIVCYSVKFIE